VALCVTREVTAHRKKIAIGAAIAVLAVAGTVLVTRSSHDEATPGPVHAAAFAWVQPETLPADWSTRQLPNSPATMPIPAGWRSAHGDPGTQTAELKSPDGDIDGYLNVTPQQGDETLANWSEFRVEHNEEEGDREVKLLAAASGLRFPTGTGSCVLDSYLTETGNRYREIACIVAGDSATTVIVAAAPPEHWAAEETAIQRAITSFKT
jgi:hypothetical protein